MKLIAFAMAAVAVLVVFAGLAASENVVEAARMTIEGRATGAEEVPAVTGPGTAHARFVFEDKAKTLTFAVTVSGLSPNLVTASHIHRAPRGTNGPVVHTLSKTGFTQVSGSLELNAADVKDLRAGNFYLNVHSKEHPGGFARLQLALPAARVTPPRTGDGGLAGPDGSSSLVVMLSVVGLAGLGVVSLFGRARRVA